MELEENLEGVKSALEFLQANEVPVKTALVCGRCKGIARQNAVLKELGPFPFCDARFNVPQAELRSLYLQAKFFLNFSVGTGGVKTKLIDALAQGIVVITNELGARGSGLEGACVIASKATISVISAALTGEAEYERLRAVSIEALREYAKQTRLVYESEFGAGG